MPFCASWLNELGVVEFMPSSLPFTKLQLAEHGGGAGVRDHNLLSSALSRPNNLAAYGQPDAADLAAAYGFGISRNHAFIDGNKRTGFVAAAMFLATEWLQAGCG